MTPKIKITPATSPLFYYEVKRVYLWTTRYVVCYINVILVDLYTLYIIKRLSKNYKLYSRIFESK